MATDIDTEYLFDQLNGQIEDDSVAFSVLKSIALLLADQESASTGREALLRALEWRESFGGLATVLDDLTRSSGLYPYLDRSDLDFRGQIAYECHRPDVSGERIVFHREQAAIYRKLMAGENVIVSAPTSFGKSRIIDAVIESSPKFQNVAVVVPTLALIDETRRRLSKLSDRFKIVSHTSQALSDRNILVFTPERLLAFRDLPNVDFYVIDEFYKISDVKSDPERTVALNEAFYRLWKGSGQFYLLGPNIESIPPGVEGRFSCSFIRTQFQTVVTEVTRVAKKKDEEKLIGLLASLDDPTLIYCSSPASVNKVANAIVEADFERDDVQSGAGAAGWIGQYYHPDWIMARGVAGGVAIHHGRLPRSLAQHAVRMFNSGTVKFLVCTSTLIEGVNTRAKNVVVWDHKRAKKNLDFFTFNNIVGRSGRMFEHFVGRVFTFHDAPQQDLPFVDFPLLTQDEDTPTALLVQIDDRDLTSASRSRVQDFAQEEVLSMETVRLNKSIDPDVQMRLAGAIAELPKVDTSRLAWSGFPRREQLLFACELIWEHLVVANRRQGVVSARQLVFKLDQLRKVRDVSTRIRLELSGQYAAKSVDEAVERVFQFERYWAGFEFPRLLMVLSRIQAEVLTRRKLPIGDYHVYAAQVESLFRRGVAASLDEYGIPLPLADKLVAEIGEFDDLDSAIEALRRVTVSSLDLSQFEQELILEAQFGM